MDTPGKIIRIKDYHVVLFDGVCNLCNGAVQFIIKRDKHNRFLFASLQSPFGQQQLQKAGFDTSLLHSIIVIHNNKILQRSNAALEIARHLTGIWPALYIFRIIPTFIRDAVYDFISKNRYRFFGKQDACMIPSKELKDKFIENEI
jgi:predicted DCC family thiol-disulfide oxidoreductase YuxK